MLIGPQEGASFDQDQVDRLRRAYDSARQSFCLDERLDGATARKLTSALIRYASRNSESDSEEIARLAVMHLRLESAPLEF